MMNNSLPFKTSRLLLAATALLLAACQKDVTTPNNTPNLRALSTTERQTLTSANDFAYRAFGALRQHEADKNIFISPLSISAALTMAYNGAAGSTKAAMKQTLGFQPLTDLQINQSYQSLFALLGGIDNQVTFTTANSLWYGQQYQLAAPFVGANQTYFGATVQGVDFNSPATKDIINGWVNTNTKGKIPTIIDRTTPDDVLYLINAIYFKGAWSYRFDPQQTRPASFFREDGSSISTDFMTLPSGAKYQLYSDVQQTVIDLPYGNRQYSMTLVVPQGTSTLADVASRLSPTQLDTWLTAANTSGLELHLPKFKLEYSKDMKDALAELGMAEAFGDSANFSQMLADGRNGLHISQVNHRAFLEVNEEGAEAAAATAVGIGVTTSVPASILVNRPFIFLIREKSSNAILFIGQLLNP